MSDDSCVPEVPSAIERLAGSGPFSAAAEDLMLYGRLVGAWDVDWAALEPGGGVADRRRCEWHFAWVLGGYGVQDVIWVVGEPPHKDGTTLRCWDRDSGTWRVAFMSPADGEFVTLVGRREGDRIVQDVVDRSPGRRPDGAMERWNFSEISETRFLWQAQTSTDRGRTWAVTHEMHARRRAP